MGDVRYISGSEARGLQWSTTAGENFAFDCKTGEYLKYLGPAPGTTDVAQFEVLATPYYDFKTDYSNIQLIDWLKMDPSNRPQPEWGASSIEENTKNLKKELSSSGTLMFLYGPSKTPAYKENEMEIGSNQCHLCGEGLLYSDINRTFVKKHRKVESHKVYMCGTTIYDTWNEHDVQPHETKKKRHIHAECILNCC